MLYGMILWTILNSCWYVLQYRVCTLCHTAVYELSVVLKFDVCKTILLNLMNSLKT